MRIGNQRVGVSLLRAGYGLGSWIAMTGLWVELPVLVQRLPEGWALASHLALYLQAANVGPVIYGACRRWWPLRCNERTATHAQLLLGSLSTLLLIFLWDRTVNGTSVAFLTLAFGLSLVDCTSSVVFLPYMAFFKDCYLTPYLVGEGLSGLLPSLVALAQGIESPQCENQTTIEYSTDLNANLTQYHLVPRIVEPRFSPEWFFVILLLMVLFSWSMFILLDKLEFCKKEQVYVMHRSLPENLAHELEIFTQPSHIPLNMCQTSESHSSATYYYLLFIQFWASVTTFGIFPAIQPYSSLPYGDSAFHWTVTLCGVAYPAACLLAMLLEQRDVLRLSLLCIGSTLVSLYALATALLSPRPPLSDSPIGGLLIVSCWVVFMFAFSYIKTMVTVLLGATWGQEGLFWCGAVTQGGAVMGALTMFLLVNVFHVFQDDGMCIL